LRTRRMPRGQPVTGQIRRELTPRTRKSHRTPATTATRADEFYMDASRLPRTFSVCCWTGEAAVLYPAFSAGRSLLALMESADPRLISYVGFSPRNSFRLGGSRSDLFAITRLTTLRNLLACHPPLQSG
jgi:hypothetical protein